MQQGAERLKLALGGLKDSDAPAKQPKFQAAKLSQGIQFDGKQDFSCKNEVSEITWPTSACWPDSSQNIAMISESESDDPAKSLPNTSH